MSPYLKNYQRQIPDYYHTMYLDGYNLFEIIVAKHNSILKQIENKKIEKETIDDIIQKNMKKTIDKAFEEIIKNLKNNGK